LCRCRLPRRWFLGCGLFWRGLLRGGLLRRLLGRGLLDRLLGRFLGGLLRDFLPCDFHSTLHAQKSGAPLALFDRRCEGISAAPRTERRMTLVLRLLDCARTYPLAFTQRSGRSAFFQSGMAEIFFSRSSTSASLCRPAATSAGKPGATSTRASALAN